MGYKCQATARKDRGRAIESYRCKDEGTTQAEYTVLVAEGKTVDGIWTGPTFEKQTLPTCERHATKKMAFRRYISYMDVKSFGHIKDR